MLALWIDGMRGGRQPLFTTSLHTQAAGADVGVSVGQLHLDNNTDTGSRRGCWQAGGRTSVRQNKLGPSRSGDENGLFSGPGPTNLCPCVVYMECHLFASCIQVYTNMLIS
jgi:hypothetical protein